MQVALSQKMARGTWRDIGEKLRRGRQVAYSVHVCEEIKSCPCTLGTNGRSAVSMPHMIGCLFYAVVPTCRFSFLFWDHALRGNSPPSHQCASKSSRPVQPPLLVAPTTKYPSVFRSLIFPPIQPSLTSISIRVRLPSRVLRFFFPPFFFPKVRFPPEYWRSESLSFCLTITAAPGGNETAAQQLRQFAVRIPSPWRQATSSW